MLSMPLFANISITNMAKVSRMGFIDNHKEHFWSQKYIKTLLVKTPSIFQQAKNLSGGNQQKVVIAKWLFRETDIFIFDEPTRGIDVGAKYEIYSLLWELAAQGKGIIIVSSDLSELMGVCQRMLVFSNGKVAGELQRDEFNQERILTLSYSEYLKKKERIS
jgi:ribose transport system ATP-binding protein